MADPPETVTVSKGCGTIGRGCKRAWSVEAKRKGSEIMEIDKWYWGGLAGGDDETFLCR